MCTASAQVVLGWASAFMGGQVGSGVHGAKGYWAGMGSRGVVGQRLMPLRPLAAKEGPFLSVVITRANST